MKRREFLQAGALAGAALGADGCATLGGLAPPEVALSPVGMGAFLGNLDRAMQQVWRRPVPQVFNRAQPAPAIDGKSERLARQALGAILLTGSFHDLAPEDQVHPGMQQRMRANMGLLDEAVLGMNAHLTSLTPTQRADVSAALHQDPDLGLRIIGAIDQEAAAAGVTMGRRTQLRSIAAQACMRLRQSPSMLIEEYAHKVEKVQGRDGSVEQFERQLAAQMGQEAFLAHKERLTLAQAKWQLALAQDDGATPPAPQELSPPPPPPPIGDAPVRGGEDRGDLREREPAGDEQRDLRDESAPKSKPGATLLTVGGILLGCGLLAGGGGVLMAVTSGGSGWIIPGLILITVGALLIIGGLVVLIIGAVQAGRG